jgi:4'-phosphopantetheinyl transferase
LNRGEIQVWRIPLDRAKVPEPTAGEAARAARFYTAELGRRYLQAHGALRAILERYTDVPLNFALASGGKPFLPHARELKFNLSHSHEMALVAVALDVEVGVDVERYRPLPDYREIADRFFPPNSPRPSDERDFFRCWTVIEAMLKARGVGLRGAGEEIEGDWTVHDIDVGPDFAAAAAAAHPGLSVAVYDYEADL